MTNAEIAAELFITPKAVEYHLGNIYAKLKTIERILGVSLESAESRTSLHVALLTVISGHHSRSKPALS